MQSQISDPQTFYHSPQSIASTSTNPLAQPVDNFQSTRKKRRRARPRHTLPTAPPVSASSSSWGAQDATEEPNNGLTSTSDEEGEEDRDADDEDIPERQGHASRSGQAKQIASPPPRKKPHLAPDDVGRFANMSIDLNGSTTGNEGTNNPGHLFATDVTSPPIDPPNAPPSSPCYPHIGEGFQSPSQGFSISPVAISSSFESSGMPLVATSVEEPDEDHAQDSDMRIRRGPSSYQIEKDRFYVTSLSDSSSDEEVAEKEAANARIDGALAGPSHSVKPHQSNGPNQMYTVNGELISRLQLLESQRRAALAHDRTAAHLLSRRSKKGRGSAGSSGSSTPPATQGNPDGALVLWKKPDDVLKDGLTGMDFGAKNQSASSLSDCPPPVVHDDGDYAYVQRSEGGVKFLRTSVPLAPPSTPAHSPPKSHKGTATLSSKDATNAQQLFGGLAEHARTHRVKESSTAGDAMDVDA